MDDSIRDPVERDVAQALELAGVRYIHETKNKEQSLDFYLPDYKCYIECKAYNTERTAEQVKGKQVILVQGYRAAEALVAILKRCKHPDIATDEKGRPLTYWSGNPTQKLAYDDDRENISPLAVSPSEKLDIKFDEKTQNTVGYCPGCGVSRIPPFLKRCSRCCDTEEKQTEQAEACERNKEFYGQSSKTTA